MSEKLKTAAKTPETKSANTVSRKPETALPQPVNSPVDQIFFLQKTIGNQAVQRLFKSGVIQAKLKIGQPNDIYEQKADRVADAVMRIPEPNVQRQTEEKKEKEEEETIQLSHELTHVVQLKQGRQSKLESRAIGARRFDKELFIMRKEGEEQTTVPKLKINYKVAKRSNKYYSGKNILGWESKLEKAAGGAYKGWADLWKDGKFDEFADAVAAYQVKLGWSGKDVDGVLGLKTWARISGLGEAMAGIRRVKWKDSETVCTKATEERIKRGHKLATGKSLTLSEDKTMDLFNAILQSVPFRMLDVESKYRGTGAAGALVYAGLGEFVAEADIWAGKLKPGAAVQVWGNEEAYELLRAGEIEEGGKKRRITDADANFYGTSFVFVRYDTKTFNRMLVRHYGSTEWKSKGSYSVWAAANVKGA